STEDFLAAMADAGGVDGNKTDLSQMQRWYDQSGTPRLSVTMDYNAHAKACILHCEQFSPASVQEGNGEESLKCESLDEIKCEAACSPFLIPLELGLLLPDGSEQGLQLEGETEAQGTNRTLLLTEMKQSFTFINVRDKPLPSLLRGFSAPVELEYDYNLQELAFLMAHDSDSFNRWAAAQRLVMQSLLKMVADGPEADVLVADAFACLLRDESLDISLKAETLVLPSESDIAEACAKKPGAFFAPDLIHEAREALRLLIANTLRTDLEANYQSLAQAEGLGDAVMQQRRFKNICLSYLALCNDEVSLELTAKQFNQATNMTDQYAALAALSHCDCDERITALDHFEKQWSHEPNVMDKWFAVQAASSLPGTLEHVKALMKHEKFDMRNPNKVRALIGTFAMRNPAAFHAIDGRGYEFVSDQVLELNKLNPQVASRMVRALINWKRVEPVRSRLMHSQLQRIADSEALSPDVYEIVSKSLA
ncbi:MAG: DUF3458 domain-containing protein, partial [Mariprofundus sp.]